MLAPARTPREIVNRLNAEWTKAAAMPETAEMMDKLGYVTVSNTSEQFSNFIKPEIVQWAKVIKEANISSLD
jgi:tripartite-type tricarboxylate transporter receptor subunit TctC